MDINKNIFNALMNAENIAYANSQEKLADYHDGYVSAIEDFYEALETRDKANKIIKERQERESKWEDVMATFAELWKLVAETKESL